MEKETLLNLQICQAIHLYPILKNIMDNLNFQDTLSCREVCLSWKSVADPLVQTKGKIVIVGLDSLLQFLSILRKSSPGSLPKTVVLKRLSLNDGFNLGLHSSFLESLTLSECDWNNDTMMALCSQLPNLNSLCIDVGDFQSTPSLSSTFIHNKSSPLLDHKYNFTKLTNFHIRGDHGSKIIAVLLLLRNSPNLKIFTYKKKHCSEADIFGNWLQTKLFSCDFIIKLKCLELDAPFYEQNLEKLRETTFLTKLSINIKNGMVDDLMKTILHLKHLKCLEVGIIDKLVLHGSCIIKTISDVCPNLEKVAIHSPSYPRITLVSVACFMLEEMQLFL